MEMLDKVVLDIIELLTRNYDRGLLPEEYQSYKHIVKSVETPIHLDYWKYLKEQKIGLLRNIDCQVEILTRSKIQCFFSATSLQVDYLNVILEEVKRMPISELILLENTVFSELLRPQDQYELSITFAANEQSIEYGFIHILKVIQLLIEKKQHFSRLYDFIDSEKFKLQLISNGANHVSSHS